MKNSMLKKAFTKVLINNAGADLLLALAVLGVVAASLIPPQILKRIIDNNLVPGRPEGLLSLAMAYIDVLILVGAFDFLKEAVLTVLGQKITREIRHGMMEKLERIYAGFFSANASGAIVSRFTNDVDAISVMFTGGIVGMLVDCFKITGIAASIWLFSPKLGAAVLVLLPMIYGITRAFQRRMLSTQRKNRILVSKVNNHIAESLKNVQMIKAFGKENYMEDKYKNYLIENYRTIEKVNYYDSVFPPIIQMVRGIVIGTIVVMSSAQMNLLDISAGMVAASIELISNLFAPIESLGMELQNIQQAFAGIGRVEEFYGEQEDGSKLTGLKAADIIPVREAVILSFDDVSFCYEEGIDVLENIKIDIRPMEKVTFTGRTGVGKSTLLRLCMGLLKPASGRITLNGIDVYDIPNPEKRKLFGYVDQGFLTIRGTVAEQISLKDGDISRVAIENALEFVGLKDYVDGLEKGMDTIVSSEALFSQGQKQLLAIARAIVTDPPILLLDEITANLDALTEEKIVSVLQRAGAAHTILSISHRLSSMIAGDTVVILENGRVKATGSPEELLKRDEWYRSHMALEKLTWS